MVFAILKQGSSWRASCSGPSNESTSCLLAIERHRAPSVDSGARYRSRADAWVRWSDRAVALRCRRQRIAGRRRDRLLRTRGRRATGLARGGGATGCVAPGLLEPERWRRRPVPQLSTGVVPRWVRVRRWLPGRRADDALRVDPARVWRDTDLCLHADASV